MIGLDLSLGVLIERGEKILEVLGKLIPNNWVGTDQIWHCERWIRYDPWPHQTELGVLEAWKSNWLLSQKYYHPWTHIKQIDNFTCFFALFFVLKYTYKCYRRHQFQVYISVALSTFMLLRNHHYHPFPELFHLLWNWKSVFIKQNSRFLPLHRWQHHLRSVSMDLITLGTLRKWNYTVFVF